MKIYLFVGNLLSYEEDLKDLNINPMALIRNWVVDFFNSNGFKAKFDKSLGVIEIEVPIKELKGFYDKIKG